MLSDYLKKSFRNKWFIHKVVHASGECLFFDIVDDARGQRDDGNRGIYGFYLTGSLETVLLGHDQIHKYDIRLETLEFLNGLVTVRGDADLKTCRREENLEHREVYVDVINQKNLAVLRDSLDRRVVRYLDNVLFLVVYRTSGEGKSGTASPFRDLR